MNISQLMDISYDMFARNMTLFFYKESCYL